MSSENNKFGIFMREKYISQGLLEYTRFHSGSHWMAKFHTWNDKFYSFANHKSFKTSP